jgi:hypothetical protein
VKNTCEFIKNVASIGSVECGVGKLKFSMDETEKISSAADVEWQRYEYVNENPKGTATKRRLTLVKKVTKVGEIFDYFKTLLEKFPPNFHKRDMIQPQKFPIDFSICEISYTIYNNMCSYLFPKMLPRSEVYSVELGN